MRRIGATQLGQGLGLNLADPLPGHSEFPANFFERADLAVVKPEAEARHILFALGEMSQCLTDGFVEESPGGRIIGDDRSLSSIRSERLKSSSSPTGCSSETVS